MQEQEVLGQVTTDGHTLDLTGIVDDLRTEVRQLETLFHPRVAHSIRVRGCANATWHTRRGRAAAREHQLVGLVIVPLRKLFECDPWILVPVVSLVVVFIEHVTKQ